MRTLPDGFDGAVMAVESISDAVAFLHGPGGCRVRLMTHSSAVFPRIYRGDGWNYLVPYYYGYPRVPATYLDEYDYINGAAYKVVEGLGTVKRTEPNLIVIINSPGAALIGDNHEKAIRDAGLEDRAVFMDESLVSMPMTSCYDHTMCTVLRKLDPGESDHVKDTVLLMGITIIDKDWKAAVRELSRYLEAMGLQVMCSPGAGASTEDLRNSVRAEYAVEVCPEACASMAEFYRGHGVKVIRSDAGAPVGFDAIESWLEAVADATGKDPSVPLGWIADEKDRINEKFEGMMYNALRIKAMTFSVAGTSSVVRPLTEWLYSYLAMAPVAVNVDPGEDPYEVSELKAFLESVDYADAFGREPVPGCGVVFCEGITAETMAINGECKIGVPIGHSSMGLDDVIPRPVYGIQGVRYFLDEILHGVRGS